MTDYTNLQTRCQRGEGRIADANNLLAECYGALGKLIAENQQLEREQKSDEIAYKAAIERQNELRAEVAGLKTGYQAYERVNAELKVEVERLTTHIADGMDGKALAIKGMARLTAETEVMLNELKNLRSDNDQLIYALKQQEQSYLVLRAEGDQLNAEVEGLDNALSVTDAAAQKWLEERTAQQTAMAEARELFDSILNDPRLVVAMPSAMLVGVKVFLSNQSAPAAMGKGEQS